MGGSRRKYKRNRAKVQVGLPKRHPGVFKPAFNLPPKFRSLIDPDSKWDEKGSVIDNYRSFGVVSNPNLLSSSSQTSHLVESGSLQIPDHSQPDVDPALDSGSELEEDDLKTALGKKRADGKSAPLQPLTTIQRIYIGRLVDAYGDDYEAMFRDIKLNKMQHSVATLINLCKRYHESKGKNPLIAGA